MIPETHLEALNLYIADIEQAQKMNGNAAQIAVYRENSLRDLWFLLAFTLKCTFLNHPFAFNVCRLVQNEPDNTLDLWARGHFKTTVISFGLTIFDLIHDPELTFGIFAHDKNTSKAIVRQIKTEFETNNLLKLSFPELCWEDPERQSPLWSLNDGITLKRSGNPREATIEAHSLLALPTGRHFSHMVCDDLVDQEAVNTPEQIATAERQFGLLTNLTTRVPTFRLLGTYYSHDDLYNWIEKRKLYKVRKIAATADGTPTGRPQLWTQKEFDAKFSSQTPYLANCQLLLNPKMEDAAGFQEKHWRTWPNENHENLNFYIIVDPARSKSKTADNTAMWLLGYGADNKVYVVDLVIDRLQLTEKADQLFKWHQEYNPLGVYYERVGMQEDIAHMEYRMEKDNYRFDITELAPGKRSKAGRIDALKAWFNEGRVYFCKKAMHVDYRGEKVNMITRFKNNEFLRWPVVSHDDGLDGLAYIDDIKFKSPMQKKKRKKKVNNVVRGHFGSSLAGY